MASLFTLDISGTLLALVFGVLVFYMGLSYWWFFVAVLIDFLVLSSLATKAKEAEKSSIKGYEKVRNWRNVVANGLAPVAIVIAYFLFMEGGGVPLVYGNIIIYSFVASVAAITADKFASEFGVLGKEPVDLITRKRVRKGTSGGVTWFGTLMGAVAAILIGLVVFAIGATVITFAVVVLSGVFGNVVDSLLGHFEEKHIGNKYTSNLLCSVFGALLCFAVLYVLPVSLLV